MQVSEKKSQIYQLRTNIKTVAALAQDTIRKVHSEAEKHQSQAQTTHTNTKTKLEEEIGVLKKQLQETVAENKERELETRKVCLHDLLLHSCQPSRYWRDSPDFFTFVPRPPDAQIVPTFLSG